MEGENRRRTLRGDHSTPPSHPPSDDMGSQQGRPAFLALTGTGGRLQSMGVCPLSTSPSADRSIAQKTGYYASMPSALVALLVWFALAAGVVVLWNLLVMPSGDD